MIRIENLIPDFLEPEKIKQSKIWNNEVVFHKGEKLQIVAPSGSGKTSLIHFLYGLRKDYRGSIHYNKINIGSYGAEDLSELRKNKISIIFQDLRLFPEQTVMRNLEIKRLLNPYHTQSRIEDMATRLGIKNKLQQLAGTCSFGEQQRIAIIRALQQPFDFLLMDEPFSHLDDNNRAIASALIEEEAAERNAGVILADLKKLEHFKAERILLL